VRAQICGISLAQFLRYSIGVPVVRWATLDCVGGVNVLAAEIDGNQEAIILLTGVGFRIERDAPNIFVLAGTLGYEHDVGKLRPLPPDYLVPGFAEATVKAMFSQFHKLLLDFESFSRTLFEVCRALSHSRFDVPNMQHSLWVDNFLKPNT